MKVMILTPTLDAKVGYDYCRSMASTAILLNKVNIGFDVLFVAGCAAIDRSRDMLMHEFLKTDATHMLQIDADIGWDPYDVVRMLEHDLDYVAGVYPVKSPERRFKVDIMDDVAGMLMRVRSAPGGFTMIKRHVIESMVDNYPLLKGVGEGQEVVSWLHTHQVRDGKVMGEDVSFCDRLHRSGFKMWIDPTINLRHWNGTQSFDHTLIRKKNVK